MADVRTSCEDCLLWASSGHFLSSVPLSAKLLNLRDLEETEHFCRWRQEEVAKIVQCEEISRKATLSEWPFLFGY